jgi:hypothetical protein
VALVAVALTAAAGLSACGGGANANALTACRGVHRALVDYDRSKLAPTPAIAAADVLDAQHQIALVMRDAAMANSEDGGYDALMTLMQQAQEVPFKDVANALRAVCKAVTAPHTYL